MHANSRRTLPSAQCLPPHTIKAMEAGSPALVCDVYSHLLNISPIKSTPVISAKPKVGESPPELRQYKLRPRFLDSPSPEAETDSKAPKARRTVQFSAPSTPKAKPAAVQTKSKETSEANAKGSPKAKAKSKGTTKAKTSDGPCKTKPAASQKTAKKRDDASFLTSDKTSKAKGAGTAKAKKRGDGTSEAKPAAFQKKAEQKVDASPSEQNHEAMAEATTKAKRKGDVKTAKAKAAVEVADATEDDGNIIKVTVLKTVGVPDHIVRLGSPENIFDYYNAILLKENFAEGAKVLGLEIDRAGFAGTHINPMKAVELGREILKISASASNVRVRVKVEYRSQLGLSFNVKFTQGTAIKQTASHYLKGTDKQVQVDAFIQHALGWRAFVLSLTCCEALELPAVKSFASHAKDFLGFFISSDPECEQEIDKMLTAGVPRALGPLGAVQKV